MPGTDKAVEDGGKKMSNPRKRRRKSSKGKIKPDSLEMETKEETVEEKTSEIIEKTAQINDQLEAKEEQIRNLRKEVDDPPRTSAKSGSKLRSVLRGVGKLRPALWDAGKSFREKAKKVYTLCPRLFNRVTSSQTLKAVGVHTKTVVKKGLGAGKNGMVKGIRCMGSLGRRVSGDTRLWLKLPGIRREIRNIFHKVGTRIYELNLQGEKNVVEDEKVKKLMEQIEKYEQKIETVESKYITFHKK